MFKKISKRCEVCGQVVTRKKFLNQTFYLSGGEWLVKIFGKKARVQGCLNCLQILESEEQGQIEKAEFEHRTIYTLHPTLLDKFRSHLDKIFNPKLKEEKNHEQSQ